MIVLASHLPGEGHFQSDLVTVRPLLCEGEYDYWAGVAAVWDSDHTLINLEHDMDVADEHIVELAECPEPLCTFAYRVHWASTGLPHDICAHSSEGRPLEHGGAWADTAAIGLCKVTTLARVGTLRREPWPRVEIAVNDATRGPWHVHRPEITHHHW